MSALVRWRDEAQLKQELARHIDDIHLVTELTNVASREIVNIYTYAPTKVATTLKEAKQIITDAARAGKMTPDKELLLRLRTEQYLRQMLTITYYGSNQITSLLLTCATRR